MKGMWISTIVLCLIGALLISVITYRQHLKNTATTLMDDLIEQCEPTDLWIIDKKELLLTKVYKCEDDKG